MTAVYTYEFDAFTEDALLEAGSGNGSNLGYGDSFVMPATSDTTFIVTDNDSYLSGDSWNNENANDSSYQTAEILVDGEEAGNGEQIYGEQYFWVWGSSDQWYLMIEIEQEGTNDDYFTFYNAYGVPEEGETLTVYCGGNISCWQPHMGCLEAPASTTPPIAVLDAITINEDGSIGDQNNDAQLNILANDFDTDGTISLLSAGGEEPGAPITVTTEGGVTVTVTVDSDGNLFFDTAGAFDDLIDGESDSFQIEYTIVDNDGNEVTSTVTVTIEGESNIVANDDVYTVYEDEAAGDVEGNVLDNDSNDFGVDNMVLKVNGQEAGVGEWIDLAQGGRVRLNESGELDFDADGDFESLGEGDMAQVQFTYSIGYMEEGQHAEYQCLFFEDQSAGTVIEDQYIGNGVRISSLNGNNPVMIFDTANPTGGDGDLATSDLGNVLILSEDCDSSDPDDNAGGGTFVFDFDRATEVHELTFLDTEEPVPTIRLYDADGNVIATMDGPVTSNGGQGVATIGVAGVHRMEIELQGSGAIDNLVYTLSAVQEVVAEDDATVTVNVIGINDLADGDELQTVEEGSGVSTLLNALANAEDVDGGTPVVESAGGMPPGASIEGDNGGLFTISATGEVTFDTHSDFGLLNTGETISTSVTYMVSDGQGGLVESTYTVVVEGKDNAIEIDAQDDFIRVYEDEGAGDEEAILDSFDDDAAANSILANDSLDGAPYEGMVVEVNGKTGMIDSWIELDKGKVKIDSQGKVDFDAAGMFDLKQDESEIVSLDYTIKAEVDANADYNVLLVIDVSNSTVGLSGDNVFVGTGVGDVNNDGRADTVLDAQIVAAQALIDDLRSQGVDPSKVKVGIVTFSGVDTTGGSSYNDATVDSAVVGTFSLDDSGIDSALSDILSGSWTNYEAGLSAAETWFGDNSEMGDNNTMYFLSDGRPITSYENGAYVEQDPSQFLDEVARIEDDFNAEINAIGVGANSSLEILNQIDSSGSAVQVTDSASLTAAILAPTIIETIADTATVNIMVEGLNEGPIAVDDVIKADEDTAVTGINIVTGDDGGDEDSTIGEDSDPDGLVSELKVTKVTVDGVTTMVAAVGLTMFSVTDAAGREVDVTIDAEGNVSVDTPEGFDTTDDMDGSFEFEYEIVDADGAKDTATVRIDVEDLVEPVKPVAKSDIIDTDEDTAVSGVDIVEGLAGNSLTNLVVADEDADGDVANLVVSEVNGQDLVNGSATITLTEGERSVDVTVNADGSVSVDNIQGFDASDDQDGVFTFTYKVTDEQGLESDAATVTINVADLVEPVKPVAKSDVIDTNEDTAISGVDIVEGLAGNSLTNLVVADEDADGDVSKLVVSIANGQTITEGGSTSFTLTEGERSVDVTVGSDGSVTVDNIQGFDETNDQDGTFTFTYAVTDEQGLTSDLATVEINVNDLVEPIAPVAKSDVIDTDEDTAVTGVDIVEGMSGNSLTNLVVADEDADGSVSTLFVSEVNGVDMNGDSTSFTLTEGDRSVDVIVGRDGSVSVDNIVGFDTTDDQDGTFTFTYKVTDEQGLESQEATVTIKVDDLVEEVQPSGPEINVVFAIDASASMMLNGTSLYFTDASPTTNLNNDTTSGSLFDQSLAMSLDIIDKMSTFGLGDIDVSFFSFESDNSLNPDAARQLKAPGTQGEDGIWSIGSGMEIAEIETAFKDQQFGFDGQQGVAFFDTALDGALSFFNDESHKTAGAGETINLLYVMSDAFGDPSGLQAGGQIAELDSLGVVRDTIYFGGPQNAHFGSLAAIDNTALPDGSTFPGTDFPMLVNLVQTEDQMEPVYEVLTNTLI